MPMDSLRGSALALILYDVGEEIHLEELDRIVGARRVGPPFKHPAPHYVRFQRPPVTEPLDAITLDGGQRVEAHIKYYDYGVVSILFELPFSGQWEELIQLASSWISSSEFERQALEIARQKLDRAASAVRKPYREWLVEDYYIFHAIEVEGAPTAATLVAHCGAQIAQTVRGETMTLSEGEQREVLQSSLSYYPNDLTVIGWHAAFLYDTAEGARTAIELLEYANSQLLEFRHYDELLTRELQAVYISLDRGTGILQRWRLVGEATRLQTVALEVTELAERADNAIKFLRDMFSARLYKLAAVKVGVIDFKDLVNQKLKTADELYRSMVQQFQQGRAFALELMVVIILVIELVFLFRGK